MDKYTINIDEVLGYKTIFPKHKALDDGSIIMSAMVRTYDRDGKLKEEVEEITGRVVFD